MSKSLKFNEKTLGRIMNNKFYLIREKWGNVRLLPDDCPATIYDCSTTQMYVILFFLEVSYFKILSFFKIQI